MFDEESGLTPRFVLSLIFQLPVTSRTVAKRRGGDQFEGWDTDRYLNVGIYNTLQQILYAFVAANSKKKPSEPKPFPVPVDTTPKPKTHKPGSFGAIALAALNKKKQRKA